MKSGIIEESDAPGGAPALLVPRSNGKDRLVVDYRALNRLIKRKQYPMPRVDDYLEAMRGQKYFALIDLAQGYYQIELSEKERQKTVFVTPDGKYQYKRLPMGLAESPSYFQKLINTIIKDLRYHHCLGYFDDLPCMGQTFNNFCESLDLLLQQLENYNLKARISKCLFGLTSIDFLGHTVSGIGIRPSSEKIQALKDLPYPITAKQLQSQLGFYNYFSRFIPNYAKLAGPLYRLISKERKFKILQEDKQSLDEMKKALMNTSLLVHFDPDKEIKLAVDASNFAVGGILMQNNGQTPSIDDGENKSKEIWCPISYFSQVLKKHQINYTITEKETLAGIVGIRKFKHYLEKKKFIIETDHHALCQIHKINFKLGRLHRWAIELSEFDYEIKYLSGEKHPADCFSRYRNEWSHRKAILKDDRLDYLDQEDLPLPISVERGWENMKFREKTKDWKVRYIINQGWIEEQTKIVRFITDYDFNVEKMQREDSFCGRIMTVLKNQQPGKEYKLHHNRFVLINNILYRKPDSKHYVPRIVLT